MTLETHNKSDPIQELFQQGDISGIKDLLKKGESALEAQNSVTEDDNLLMDYMTRGDTSSFGKVIEKIVDLKKGKNPVAGNALEVRLTDAAKKHHGVSPSYIRNAIKKGESKEGEKKGYGKYEVNEEGLYYHPPKKEGAEKEPDPIWICPPIYPEARLMDSEGYSHHILIKIFNGKKYCMWPMQKGVILDLKELGKTLCNKFGFRFPLHPAYQKHLQQFLMNSNPSKECTCVNKAGWHGNQYAFPDGIVMGDEMIKGEGVFPVTQFAPQGVKQKGTLEEWQDNVVVLCKKNSRLITGLGIGFGGVTLKLVNQSSGGVNYIGPSTIGKSICQLVSISIWGSEDLKKTWRITSNALEGICALHNDSMLPLDEYGQVNAKEAGEIVYMISQGRGKDRMKSDSTLRDVKTWRVMIFSTGEHGLEAHMKDKGMKTKAGQVVRFADVPGAVANGYGCFEHIHGENTPKDFAEKLERMARTYYGNASREFVKKITENLEEAKKHLEFTIQDFVAMHAHNCSEQVCRVVASRCYV